MWEGRTTALNTKPACRGGKYVLYWIQANRRVEYNHALSYAISLANELDVPLLCYEELDCETPYASDRFFRFVLEGTEELGKELRRIGAGYTFYLRADPSQPRTRLAELAAEAAAVVTDDHPTLAEARQFRVAATAVDSSCIVPMSLIAERAYAAYSIRPKIRKLLPRFLVKPDLPKLNCRYRDALPDFHCRMDAGGPEKLLAASRIEHGVGASLSFRGGRRAGLRHLKRFVEERLSRYAKYRNDPTEHATSDLSPYLHYGYVSALEVALEVMKYAREQRLIAEEFLEQLIVRRELAFNFARHTGPEQRRSLGVLPQWARATLEKHRKDNRPRRYGRNQLLEAGTADELWNAAQKEMLLRGKIHGYTRMYWGKKLIEWTRDPEEALELMLELHDRWALDGRDPNTYANILWCFGLHDRPFAERPVFGTVRYMSLEGMKRKIDVASYCREIETLERTGKDPFRIE